MIKKIFIVCLFIVYNSYSLFSYNINELNKKEAILFSIFNEKDSINFIVLTTNINEKKPIFLFCQEKNALPLFVEREKNDIFFYGAGIANFDYNEIKKRFHIVVVSKKNIPLILKCEQEFFNDIELKEYFARIFQEENNISSIEEEIQNTKFVINFLKNENWVKKDELVIAGYSRGAEIATIIAKDTEFVSKLIIFNPEPLGIAFEKTKAERKIYKDKKIIFEETEEVFNIIDKDDCSNLIETLESLSIPFYLAYGFFDYSAEICDIIPFLFEKKAKNNLTHKRYFLGHNFCEVDENGNEDGRRNKWDKVVKDCLEWLYKN